MEILKNKWVGTVASIWIQCTGGGSYTFSIYSSALKSSQHYDQSTLDTVAVFKDIGSNFGTLSGLLFSAATSDRYRRYSPSSGRRVCFGGPWVVHLVGAIQGFTGFFLIWAAVAGVIPRPPVPAMCLFLFMGAQSQTFFSTANVVSGVHNFGDYGGTIVGMMKGFLSLSAAILIQVYQTVCEGELSNYLLILALLPTLVSLVLMCLVRIYEANPKDDKKHLDRFSAIALIIAAYLMIVAILENIFTLPSWVRVIKFIFLLLLLASPLGVAVKAQLEESEQFPLVLDPQPLLSETFSADEEPVEYHQLEASDAHQVTASSNDNMLPHAKDMNLWQAMRTGNFWFLFLAMVCGMGSGLATINNMSQIGQSLGYTTTEISFLVSLWSTWNFLGRFGAGYVSDFFLRTRCWARPLLMAAALATMAAGHLIIASGFTRNLYVGLILVGVCYGSMWSLMPTITAEIFGVRHMGTIFNTITIASPIGSYVLSVRIIGYLYDKEATGEDNSCTGTHCFMLSFVIMAFVALFGSLTAFALYIRTKRFYEVVVFSRLQHSSRP